MGNPDDVSAPLASTSLVPKEQNSNIMTLQQLNFLKDNRKYLRSKVTRIVTRLNNDLPHLTLSDLIESHDDVLSMQNKLSNMNADISKGLFIHVQDRTKLDEELENCDNYEDKLRRITRKIKDRIDSLQNIPIQNPVNVAGPSLMNLKLKLPELPLPEFSNARDESLDKFFDNFENVINKYSLSSYEKFIFLSKQLHEKPLILIKSLEGSQQSYEVAKDLLTRAFASPITKKYDIIKRLSDLKLDDRADPYSYIAEMRIIIETFRKIEVDVDDVIQYFVWHSLNDSMKTQFIHIVNKSRPSLDDIQDKIFEATERYLEMNKYMSSPRNNDIKKIESCAVDIKHKQRFRPCILCVKNGIATVDHPINKCSVYSTAKAKIDMLKKFNCCLKCGNEGHETNNCKFNFLKKCFHCSKNHFSYLCVSKPENSNNSGSADKKSISNSTAVISSETVYSKIGSDVILPTFTCSLPNGVDFRCLKDTGSQSNFVSSDFASANNLKIVFKCDDIVVNGINASKDYESNIVEVPTIVGNKRYVLYAVCIPRIRTSLSLPNLSDIVKRFKEKGYVLADKLLSPDSTNLSNINFIFGSISSHCLPESTVVFGGDSSYVSTPIGAMLNGSSGVLLKNLPSLPNCMPENSLSSLISSVENTNSSNNDAIASTSTDIHSSVASIDIISDKLEINSLHISVLDKNDQLIDSELERAASEIAGNDKVNFLSNSCVQCVSHDNDEKFSNEIDLEAAQFVLNNTVRDDEGRLESPLMWNKSVSHLLGNNFRLCHKILQSNFKKLQNSDRLLLVDKVIKDQESLGVVQRIDNVDQFIDEHPEASFLAHMPVFRMNNASTKVRVVYLSNACEPRRDKSLTLNHNQCMVAGPCLNSKISISLIHLRFDTYLLIFDLVKAFLQIKLKPEDQIKLCFLWYKNCERNDYSVVAYKSKRLPFGLRCSPAILLLALYRILILDAANDVPKLRELKSRIYTSVYMDNCSISAKDTDELRWCYEQLEGIFGEYKFKLQQFVSNCDELQNEIDSTLDENTPEVSKVLGLLWNRKTDTLSTLPIKLDASANTKRKILSSIASNYDIFNYNGPLMNRSRIFMHELQCDGKLDWDDVISSDRLRIWNNIAKQANNSPPINIPRFVGNRDDQYDLIAFTDSSKLIVGCVVYVRNLSSGQISFILAKNKIVGKKMAGRTIPNLELQAIDLGSEILIDLNNELTGTKCANPINIRKLLLYSDSFVCLQWLNSYCNKLDKMKNISVFAMNRMKHISAICEKCPITFSFCAGEKNPADAISRPLSYHMLSRSNYFTGPTDLLQNSDVDDGSFRVIIPNPDVQRMTDCSVASTSEKVHVSNPLPLFEHSRYSSFVKIQNIYAKVLKFINIIKISLKSRDPVKYQAIETLAPEDILPEAKRQIIMRDQYVHFGDVFEYFAQDNRVVNDMPPLISQMNLFISDGILKVKCKLKKYNHFVDFPVLLSKSSIMSEKIIVDIHERMKHAGLHSVLSELRKEFWLLHGYSTVRRVLKQCVLCRRFNSRTVKLNQNSYRDFRSNPPRIPYRSCFVDFFGYYKVKTNGDTVKVYVLCITCLFTRAINLKVCKDLTVDSFMRALQLHVFEFGVPETIYSDLGSQIVAGGNLVSSFLNDENVREYFASHKMKSLSFQQYPKGCNKLGSLVESCVKIVKRLIHGSIRNNILTLSEFEFVVAETVHLANKRPIAFKESLRDNSVSDEIPSPITPELLLHGYDLPSLNLVPNLQPISDLHDEWSPNSDLVGSIRAESAKLCRIRKSLIEKYNEEFLVTLVKQSVNEKDRFKPYSHKPLRVGDIVLLKELHTKPANYPMAIIKDIHLNDLDEITEVTVRKGTSREIIRRHVTAVVPYLSCNDVSTDIGSSEEATVQNNLDSNSPKRRNNRRNAARQSEKRSKNLFTQGLA